MANPSAIPYTRCIHYNHLHGGYCMWHTTQRLFRTKCRCRIRPDLGCTDFEQRTEETQPDHK